MVWRHVGGGCMVDPAEASDPDFPCDDQYENEDGDWAYFDTTREAHFSMPEEVDSLDEVEGLPGVKFRKVEPPARN